MTIGRFAGAIVSVLLLAIVAIVLITLSQDAAFREDVFSEIVKHLLQLAVVITVGGGIAALFKTFEHARDRAAKARDEALRQAHLRAQTHEDYLKRLGTFYRSVKSSRRR